MFCPHCGTQVTEGAAFCGHCGGNVSSGTDSTTDIHYRTSTPAPAAITVQHSMKWFKFLIYFSLFVGAFLNLIYGYLHISGNIWETQGVSPKLVYDTFPSMLHADLYIGVGSIVLAILLIVTRFRLAGYCKNGPTLLIISYVFSLLLPIGYIAACQIAAGIDFAEVVDSSTFSSIATNIFMIIANVTYFKKRKYLFVK